MDGEASSRDHSGSLSDPAVSPDATPTTRQDSDTRRALVAATVLRAQARSRMIAAALIAAVQSVLMILGEAGTATPGALGAIAATTALYVLAVYALHRRLEHADGASRNHVTAALVADLAYVLTMTGVSTTPAHYERALFGMIVIVHVANFYFGGRHARRVVAIGSAGYLVLLTSATARGMSIEIGQELWSLAICAAVASLMVYQASDVRRRLRTIVGLFEHAEQGDFTRGYEVSADHRPDAITRVGRAYNGVRTQLANMVLTDSLTGCLNRRGFDQALEREVARASRGGGTFALLALDLDHFKLVNDTFGHLAGDIVLRNIGALLLRTARATDVVARVGGEEFAFLLPDTDERGAQLLADRICHLIRSSPFDVRAEGARVRVTTSIGVVAGTAHDDGRDFAAHLWSRADAALYAAKRKGRDRAYVWTADLDTVVEVPARISAETVAAVP